LQIFSFSITATKGNAMTIKRMYKHVLLAGIMSLATTTASAAGSPWLFGINYDAGGDDIATVVFTDGSSSTLSANEGLHFYVGKNFANGVDSPWHTHASIGYKTGSVNATNGDLSWSSWPLEVMEFYNMEKVRFGGGLVYQLNPKAEGSGFASGLNLELDNALGFVLQFEYRLTPAAQNGMALGLRYTNISYSSINLTSEVNGSTIGGVFTITF
jgi:hypothetical protein